MYTIQFYNTIEDSEFFNENIASSLFEKASYLKANLSANQSIEYLIAKVEKKGDLVAKLLIQMVPFQGKELRTYVSEESPCLVKATIESVLDKINWKMAVIGNLFVSSENGQFWSSKLSTQDRWQILKRTCSKLKKTNAIDTILLSDICEADSKQCKAIEKEGFKLFEIEPNLYLDLPKEWTCFEDYLQAMKSKYRVRAKKVLKDSAAIEPRNFSKADILKNTNQIQKLHKNVTSKIGFKLAEVSASYFYEMKKALPQQFELIAYYLENKMIGFISTFDNGNELEVHLIGLDYKVNKSHSLYQRILYDCVKLGIEKKQTKINFGKTATTIKTTVGAKTERVYSLLKHNNTVSNLSLKPFFHFLKPEPLEIRNPFKEVV